MSDRPDYLQLEANDDIVHLRDRLSFIRGRRVLIVWPERGTALNRRLDVVLVQREARRRNVQIAFVTHDREVIQHAADLGISTFETIGAAEGARWRRSRPRIFTRRDHRPDDEPDPDDLKDVASRVHNRPRELPRLPYLLLRLVVVIGLVAVVGGMLYAVVPSATLVITLTSQRIATTLPITADPTQTDVDVEAARIPATVLQVEVQTVGTVPATGISALGNTAAIGIATFTNQTLSPVTIRAGVEIATPGDAPVVFRTTADAELRGGVGQRADVPVEAVGGSVGDRGNVPPGVISVVRGELAAVVTVSNNTATAGGETRQFTTVTQDDLDNLLTLVRVQLQSAAYQEMLQSLSESQVIVIETIRIVEERTDWTRYDRQAGDIADSASLDMRAIVEAVVVDDRFTRQVMFARLSAQKPAGKLLLADTFTYTRGTVLSTQGSSVTFEASAEMVANATIETSQLAERIAGRTVEEARTIIAQSSNLAPGVIPQFTLSPEAMPHLPLLPVRIAVQVVYQ